MPSMRLAVSAAPAASMSAATTVSPSAAKRSHKARPMPCAAPVTTTIRAIGAQAPALSAKDQAASASFGTRAAMSAACSLAAVPAFIRPAIP